MSWYSNGAATRIHCLDTRRTEEEENPDGMENGETCCLERGGIGKAVDGRLDLEYA